MISIIPWIIAVALGCRVVCELLWLLTWYVVIELLFFQAIKINTIYKTINGHACTWKGMSSGLCMFTEHIMSLLNYLSSLNYNKNKECSIPVWAMPPEIRTTFHALRGRTMTMSLLNGSYLSAQVQEEGKICLHWYFRQQNFL